MDRKKHYQNPKIQEDLYQYEMGIDLGAEIEVEKSRRLHEYQKERAAKDHKGEQHRTPSMPDHFGGIHTNRKA